MKRVAATLCAAALLFSLAACGGQEETAAVDYSNTTLTGQVTKIDGTVLTLKLGTLTEQEQPAPEQEQPSESPPSAGNDGTSEKSEDGTPPEPKETGEHPAASNNGEAPEKPEDGTVPDGAQEGNTVPEAPSGGTSLSFTAGEETAEIDINGATITRDGSDETAALDSTDIAVDDIVVITVGEHNAVDTVAIQTLHSERENSGFGFSGTVTQGSAATTINTDGAVSNTTYASTGDDENALRVDGATVTLDSITVEKSGGASSNTEDGDFYGMNAALLATNGAKVTITDAVVTSSAQNGNGVFSYGTGTEVNISDSSISTTADNSGGIQTTGGGTTNASNLTVTTAGNSAAAIRSDRGGGTVNVNGGTYTSNGYNSPAVYSTADITVKDAVLTANQSEALVIEGQNSITLENCDVSGNMNDTEGASAEENVHNVMIYQSMSGDAEIGSSSFSMTGGSLTSHNGDLFYVTNTHCTVYLSGVDLINEDADGKLLLVTGNGASRGWGSAGSNGGQVEFIAAGQALSGEITVDSISTLNLTLRNQSTLTGTIQIVENAQGGTAVGNNAVVTIEQGSTWILTGDCTITSLDNQGTIQFNGHTITLADGSVLSE